MAAIEHRESTVREGHRGLARKFILGGLRTRAQGPSGEMVAVQRKKFYFGPKIMVQLRATQADFKRANAKKEA
jgi:hypothetical protein